MVLQLVLKRTEIFPQFPKVDVFIGKYLFNKKHLFLRCYYKVDEASIHINIKICPALALSKLCVLFVKVLKLFMYVICRLLAGIMLIIK